MPEMRLVDPLGYDAVTDGYLLPDVPGGRVAEQAAHLKAVVAPRHAAEHPYANYHPAEYTVRVQEDKAC